MKPAIIGIWTSYLCYCKVAFMERTTGGVQMHLVKPNARTDVVGF